MDALKRFTNSSLFLPVVALAVLLLFNAFFTDGFLQISMTEDGHLYGRLVDILNRSCSLVILALGMTFVIATSGIDISVGAVIAISAAVVCTLLGGRGDGVAETPMALAMLAAVAVIIICLIQSKRAQEMFNRWKERHSKPAVAGSAGGKEA